MKKRILVVDKSYFSAIVGVDTWLELDSEWMGRKKGMQGLWRTPAELQGFPFKQGQFLNQETPSTLAQFESYSLPSSKASYQ